MNFQFPIDLDWSTDEIVKVVECLDLIEKAYHQSVEANAILDKYRAFKTVVPSLGEEKRIGRAFEVDTGYSLYQTIKAARSQPNRKIKMTAH
ncbi:UPF0223 protein [Halolactibacillus alkaliphilus]|uniref:UPF0223 protein n=1 Tax=Halolactibacillus alkaliphilus TaxID=442899 RepID=A0A511X3I3_9BACI|nr:UPF0223 family protein [Halolactibacillus alkaliphilus]GEN57502.1 UPF0223 protein [Halolactibacillus alkaliphilus]GGN73753.1 UPF0223 protein [Halolactibacillus alkaliphilus]SFO98280.1 Uncharacterized protein YktA, UPF0223 family [Halolactibacillus alkaliphilus]